MRTLEAMDGPEHGGKSHLCRRWSQGVRRNNREAGEGAAAAVVQSMSAEEGRHAELLGGISRGNTGKFTCA